MGKRRRAGSTNRFSDWTAENIRVIPPLKPPLLLTKEDRDAVAILARAKEAARMSGWSEEKIAAFEAEATSGDDSHLRRVTAEYFAVS